MMDILSTLFQQRNRQIGLIVSSAVISEKHDDPPETAKHPVGVSAVISDHAFRRLSEVVMQVGFTGGGSLPGFIDTSSLGLSMGIGPKEAHQELLSLQSSKVLLDMVIDKRVYTDVPIHTLRTTTDRTSESILSAVLTLREATITSTTIARVAPKSNVELGANTSAVQNSGVKTPA